MPFNNETVYLTQHDINGKVIESSSRGTNTVMKYRADTAFLTTLSKENTGGGILNNSEVCTKERKYNWSSPRTVEIYINETHEKLTR